nr:MAG TPA: hypothetical protein [Caudoviricetes sp.]
MCKNKNTSNRVSQSLPRYFCDVSMSIRKEDKMKRKLNSSSTFYQYHLIIL